VRTIEYKHVLKPSIEYLEQCGSLMLDTPRMAEFLGVPTKTLVQLVYTDRIPLPCRLGLGKCQRWSVLELLEWVEAGCPRREKWIEMRGSSGWCPQWRW
jgi:predicted DNA-binding transcriptional regulator AlpA